MKRKRFPPNQLSLNECLKHIRNACSLDTLDMIRRTSSVTHLHDDLGRWMRNNCGLWEDGTDRVVADIIVAYKEKRYHIPHLHTNKFVHPELPFDLKNAHRYGNTFHRELFHPDNCSCVIIEILISILKEEHELTN